MKIIYIVNARIPTEKAHGIQIMKMCEAFANAGNKVELVVPRRLNNLKVDPFEYYGVEKKFKIKKLPTLDLINFGKIGFLIQSFSFSLFLLIYLVLFRGKRILYIRGEVILPVSLFFRKNIFWETHIRPKNNKRYSSILNRLSGIIVVTSYYKEWLIKNYNIPENNVLYFPDSVDLEKFDINLSKDEARKKLDLS